MAYAISYLLSGGGTGLVGVHTVESSVSCNTYIIACIISYVLAGGGVHAIESSVPCNTYIILCIISYVLSGGGTCYRN